MTIVIAPILKPKSSNHFAFTVRTDGLTVIVGATSFKIDGAEYSLAEDEAHTLTADNAHEMRVMGYLVKDQENEVHVLVDESFRDGVTRPHNFQIDQTYRLIYPLFDCVLPVGCTSLDEVRIQVRQFQLLDDPPSLDVLRMREGSRLN